jgi:hypothetical protein
MKHKYEYFDTKESSNILKNGAIKRQINWDIQWKMKR